MKFFEEPKLELLLFTVEDIVTVSLGGDEEDNGTVENQMPKG